MIFRRMMLATVAMAAVAVPVCLAGAPGSSSGDRQRSDRPQNAARPAGEAPRHDHLETPNDAYLPAPRSAMPRSPGGRYTRNGYELVQVNVDENGENIVGDAANEPSIAVDITDPQRMAIGWRQFDTISSDFRQAGWGYTADGGNSWAFPGVIDPGVFRSDPVLDHDAEGNFYYNSLTSDTLGFWCKVYRSTDGGASWDDGVYAYGGDKQWMTIDRTEGVGRGNLYAFWTDYWSICYPGSFTRSYDGGASFLDCIEVPGTPFWGTATVGPDGELYLVGDGMTITKSSTLQDESQPADWDFSTTVDLDGSLQGWSGPNPGGLMGQAWVATDHSAGPTRGNVYVCASVDRYSTADPGDVMFARSTDGGVSWSDPVRVNDDPADNGAYQWFGTMSVAPNGRIDVIWADTRDDPSGYDSELYYAYSEDGGTTWSPNEAFSPPWDPHVGWPQQNKIGDYYDMVSLNSGAHVACSTTLNGEQDVYHAHLRHCSDAGTLELDAELYACSDKAAMTVVDCGLNADDEVIETVEVTIASDAEPDGETVLLTETGPSSAQFTGTIDLSETDAGGVLKVADGDTVTATYLDADDGAGGYDVEVTDDAVVDCVPPAISGVDVTEIGPYSGTVTFAADEPVQPAVHYGLSCGSLGDSVAGSGYATELSVALSDLEQDTTYFFAVEAEDVAGNQTYDDAGGACYSFTTLPGPKVIHEFNMDTDPGWSMTGEWEYGQPLGMGGTQHGYADPDSGATGENVCGVDLSGDYSTSSGGPYFLTTGPMDCSDATEVGLRFQRWLNTDYQPYVSATIEVSNNGSTWHDVWENGSDEIAEQAWSQQVYDISQYADGEPEVYIRWGYQVSSGAYAYSGWNIDDVEIWGAQSGPQGDAVQPESYTIVRGELMSGGLAELLASDDARMMIRLGFVLSSAEPPVWLEVEGTATTATPSDLWVTLEAGASTVGLTQRIRLFNHDTQSFEELDTGFATPADSVVQVKVPGDPARFVHPDTLEMRAELTWKANGPVTTYPWQVGIDQVMWTVKP